MRWFVLLLLLLSGCVTPTVKRVDWFHIPLPTKNGVFVCTYIAKDKRLVCATPEDYILIQEPGQDQDILIPLEP